MTSPLRPLVLLGAVLALGPLAAGAQAPRRLTLAETIALAQAQGFAARSAEATRDAAAFRDRQFRSRLLPQLSLDGTVPSYNRSIIEVQQPDGTSLFRPRNQTNANLNLRLSQKLPFTGGDLFIASSLAQVSVSGPSAFDTWSSTPLTIGVRQDIFRPNTARWDQREQSIRGDLAERQFREAREDVAITVTGQFFDVFAARMQLENATKNAAVNDTLYTLNKGRFEVGKIGENDLLQSELALLRSRNALDGARLTAERARAALRLLLDLPPGEPLAIDASAEVPDVTPDTALAVQEALRNRALASDADLQAVQARRRVSEAQLNNGLGATVSASYGFNATGGTARDAYQNLLEARQFTVAVDIPLLQWGLRKESVAAARADQERVRQATRLSLDQLAQDAHFAALELVQARSTLTLSAKADTVAQRRFEVAYNRYVIGRIAIDNLYIAQSEKDAALGQYVQSLRGFWAAYYRLRRVTLFDFQTGQPIR